MFPHAPPRCQNFSVANFKTHPKYNVSIVKINLLKVSTGKGHSLFLTEEGKVLSSGLNSSGQCGVGKGKEFVTPKIINYMGPDIVDVST